MIERIEDDPDDFGLDDYELPDEIDITTGLSYDYTITLEEAQNEELAEIESIKFYEQNYRGGQDEKTT